MSAPTLVMLAAVVGASAVAHGAHAQSANCSPDLPDPDAGGAGSIPLALDLGSLPGAGRLAANPLQALAPRVRGYARGMNGGVTADGLQSGITAEGLNTRRIDRSGNRGMNGGATTDGMVTGGAAGGVTGQVYVAIPTVPSRRTVCAEPEPLDDVLQGEPGDVLHGEPAGDLLRGDRPRRRVGTVQIETPSRP